MVLTGFTKNNTSLVTAWNYEGATAQDITYDFDRDTANLPTGNGSMSQLAKENRRLPVLIKTVQVLATDFSAGSNRWDNPRFVDNGMDRRWVK